MNPIFLNIGAQALIALCAVAEAASEGPAGMQAVMNVVENRTYNLQRFGDMYVYGLTDKYHAVILKNKQFSAFNPGTASEQHLTNMAANFNYELQSNQTLQQAYSMAGQLLAGTLPDNTGGAVYYHRYDIYPSWASDYTFLGQIGAHLFYTDGGMYARSSVAAVNIGLYALIPVATVLLIKTLKNKRR